MFLRGIQEIPVLYANMMLEEDSRNSFEECVEEIGQMCEIYGRNFEKGIYEILFENIDFYNLKDQIKERKVKFFVEHFKIFVKQRHFISLFSEILMLTTNEQSMTDIYNGLCSVIKLTIQDKLKIIMSFIRSSNPKYLNEAKQKLIEICNDMDIVKSSELEESFLEELISMITNLSLEDKINLNYLVSFSSKSNSNGNKYCENSMDENLFDVCNDLLKEPVNLSSLYSDLGPSLITDISNFSQSELLAPEVDASAVAELVLNILTRPLFQETREDKIMIKLLLGALDMEREAKNVEDFGEEKTLQWNLEKFEGIGAINKNVKLKDVLEHLDDPRFHITDSKKFEFFLKLLKDLKLYDPDTSDYDDLINFMFKKWENESNQIELLKFLLTNPSSDLFSLKNFKGNRVKLGPDQLSLISKPSQNSLIEPWTIIPMIEILINLSRGTSYAKVKSLFIWPISNCPEILALALAQVNRKKNDFIHEELIEEVFYLFLNNHMNSFSVIEEIWNNKKDLIIHAFANMYNNDPTLMNLSRILDLTQKLNDGLMSLVKCDDYYFAVNLAILAVKRDFLHIDMWLKERISNVGEEFIIALIKYLNDHLIIPITRRADKNIKTDNILERNSQLTLESLGIILENLLGAKTMVDDNKKNNNDKKAYISIYTEKRIQELTQQMYKYFPMFFMDDENRNEINNDTSALFNNVLNGNMTIDDFIEKLYKYKNSNNKREREIYACVIYNLLEEFKNIHKFPENVAATLGKMLGQIINGGLIDGLIEVTALKYIVESIKTGKGPLFIFGTIALRQILDKLRKLSAFVKTLIETSQLKIDKDLYEKVLKIYKEINNNSNEDIDINNSPQSSSERPGYINEENEEDNIDNNNNSQNLQNLSIQGLFNMGNFGLNNIQNLSGINNMSNISNISNISGLSNLGNIPGINNMAGIGNLQGNNINNINNNLANNLGNINNNMLYDESNQRKQSDQLNPYIYGLNGSNVNEQQFQGIGLQGNLNQLNPLNPIQNQIVNQRLNMFPIGLNNINLGGIRNIGSIIPQGIPGIENFGIDMKNNMINIPQVNQNPNISQMIQNNSLSLNDSSLSPSNMQDEAKILKKAQNSKRQNNIFDQASDLKLIQNPGQEINEKFDNLLDRLNKENIPERAKEIQIMISGNEGVIKLLSNYLLTKYIKNNESNEIFGELVDVIGNRNLNEIFIHDTLKEIMKLLSSSQIEKSKHTLKNLGNWLGVLTLRKDRPIWAMDLDFRMLLEQALVSGKLGFTLPFVRKVLEQTVESTVFNLPNPWLLSILSLLKEIYRIKVPDRLRHEIELLFSRIHVNPKDIPDTTFFSSHVEANGGGIESYSENKAKSELTKKIRFHVKDVIDILRNKGGGIISDKELIDNLANILSESINEIITPIIERAVTISLITTKELVIKDYQFDMDEKNFINATTNMIKSLAGSLGFINSREPLRATFINKFKDFLEKKRIENDLIEEIEKAKCIFEILDIGYSIINNSVLDKALEEMKNDHSIIKEAERRRKGITYNNILQNTQNGQNTSNNPSISNLSTILQKLPFRLRPSPSSIQSTHQVYKTFSRPFLSLVFPPVNVVAAALSEALSKQPQRINREFEKVLSSLSERDYRGLTTGYKDIEISNEDLKIYEKCIKENKLNELNISQEEKQKICSQLVFSTFKCLINAYKHKCKPLMTIYNSFIQSFISINFSKPKEVTISYMLYASFDLIFDFELTKYLFQKKLIDIEEYEKYLLMFLEMPILRKRTRNLLKKLNESQIFNEENFKNFPPFWMDEKRCNEYYTQFSCPLPRTFLPSSSPFIDYALCNIKDAHAFETFVNMSLKIFRKISDARFPLRSPQPSDIQRKLTSYSTSPFFLHEEQLNVFTMIVTEWCAKMKAPEDKGETGKREVLPDSLSRFIVTSVSAFGDKVGKESMFTNMLNGMFRTFHFDYIKNRHWFDQRPYYKMIYNLLYLIDSLKSYLPKASTIYIVDLLKILNPQNYPGFFLAWLDLISSNIIIKNILSKESNKGEISSKYFPLFADMLNFLRENSGVTYKDEGLKIIIDNVYKFSYLLCRSFERKVQEYYLYLLISLPYTNQYTQLKNIILSSTPETFKIIPPKEYVLSKSEETFEENKIVNFLTPSTILKNCNFLQLADKLLESNEKVNIENICEVLRGKNKMGYIINCILIYCYEKKGKEKLKDIFIAFIKCLDGESLEILYNAILNQLRFPCKSTIDFIDCILSTFESLSNEKQEEKFLYFFLERLRVRPVPWGVQVLFYKISSSFLVSKREIFAEIQKKLEKNFD